MIPYSVVIPAYNTARTIAQAIRSVSAQTCRPTEIIVVDDGSTDKTAAIAGSSDPLVRTIHQENRGCGTATTRGLVECLNDIIATIDADDLWLPHKMERQLQYLSANVECDAVFARVQPFRDDGSVSEERDAWLRSTMVIRRGVCKRVGPIIDPPGRRGDLVDWLARARELGLRLDMLPETLVRRRIHPDSLAYGRDVERDKGYLFVARQAILRRRKSKEASENKGRPAGQS